MMYRTGISTIPAEKASINWTVYETIGSDVYSHEKAPEWPPTSLETCEVISTPKNRILEEKAISEGSEILVHALFGFDVGVVHEHPDGSMYAMAPTGNTMYPLKFEKTLDPPRWISQGSVNLRALKRLNLRS